MKFVAEDGTEVPIERWGFCVTYDNGDKHYQFDRENERYNNFRSIDLDRAIEITMINTTSNKKYSAEIPKGGTLVHYYDNIVQRDLYGNERHIRLYAFGYEMDGVRYVQTILPDDTLTHESPDVV